MKISIKKTLALAIILGIFINPILMFAQVVPSLNSTPTQTSPSLKPNYTDAQIKEAITIINSTSGKSNASSSSNASSNSTMSSSIASGAAGCGAGQLLSTIISSSVTKAIGGKATTYIDKLITVPVSEQGSVGENIKTQTSAKVGTVVGTGGISSLTMPGWDAVAYCIVNAMIIYISDSTIQWINTGFKGNPAFINNPDAFFKQLADEEAAGFIQGMAYGTLGLNIGICDAFKKDIILTVANQYIAQRLAMNLRGGGYGAGTSYGGCSFNNKAPQLNSFLAGNTINGGGWNTWYQVSQNPNNNPYDSYFKTTDALNQNVNKTVSTANKTASWNSGFLNFETCKDEKKHTGCTTKTPGTVIQNQLNETLNLGKNRLVLATKFDQVVTALINQLIKTAIGHVLQPGK